MVEECITDAALIIRPQNYGLTLMRNGTNDNVDSPSANCTIKFMLVDIY